MKKILMRSGVVATSFLPVLALAQSINPGTPNLGYFSSLLSSLNSLINTLFPLVFAAAVLGFLIGLGMYFLGGGDEASKEKAMEVMKYGLIVLFVMFAVYGLIKLAASVLGVGLDSSINIPQIPR